MEFSKFKQKIKNEHDELTFGKYKGKSIAQVLLDEPSYILWLYEEEIIDFPEDIIIKAEQLDDD